MSQDSARQNYVKENYRAYLDGKGRLEWFLAIIGENPSTEDRESLDLLERELGTLSQSQTEKLKQFRVRLLETVRRER